MFINKCTMDNKAKLKLLLKGIIIFTLAYFILLHIGLLPYPKSVVKLYFKLNYSQFENVKNSMMSSKNDHDSFDAFSPRDNTLSMDSNAFDILYLGQYESITEYDDRVDFRLMSLLGYRPSRACGITYLETDKQSFNEYIDDKTGYHYEQIDDNWYLCTRMNTSEIPKS